MKLNYQRAKETDLPALVALYADDPLGSQRENPGLPLDPRYVNAFTAIDADPNNQLVVVKNEENTLVGTMQLTFIPYLNRLGSWRCQIESVRIASEFRGLGLGQEVFEWAIQKAQERGCQWVQLTSDKQRPDALRFYERLGFTASHEGFKLKLSTQQ